MCLRFCDFWIALLTFTWEQFSAGRSLTGMSYLATWPIWHNHWLCQLCMMTLSTFASHLMCSPVSSILCIDNFVIVKGSYLFCGALFEPRPHPKKGLVSSVWMNVLGHDESKIRTFNDDIYIYYTCMYIMYIYIYTHVGIPSHRKVHALQTHTHTDADTSMIVYTYCDIIDQHRLRHSIHEQHCFQSFIVQFFLAGSCWQPFGAKDTKSSQPHLLPISSHKYRYSDIVYIYIIYIYILRYI